MEIYAICIAVGMIAMMCAFAAGVIIGGRMDKNESGRDSDVRIYKPMRNRMDRRGDRYDTGIKYEGRDRR